MLKPHEQFGEFEVEQKKKGVVFPQQYTIRIGGKNVDPLRKKVSK